MKTESPKFELGSRIAENYGADYQTHLLEQYKVYVGMADKISERRHSTNSFFLSINTGIVAFLGITWPAQTPSVPKDYWYVLIALCGIMLCYSWYRIVTSYRGLNDAKYKVVHAIEAFLPVRPYDAEWDALGRGMRSDLYLPFTHIEQVIPWIFMVIHVSMILFVLVARL